MPIERWQVLTTFAYPVPAPPQQPPAQQPAPQQPAPQQPAQQEPPPLRMTGLWLRIADLVPAKRIIRIVASGEWSAVDPAEPIGPDGYLNIKPPAAEFIASDALPGTLMGKIGGSTADRVTADKIAADKRTDLTIFPVGTFCVVAPLEKAAPLFVAVNGAWNFAEFHFRRLRVEVSTSEP